jgi:hypothetical protein
MPIFYLLPLLPVVLLAAIFGVGSALRYFIPSMSPLWSLVVALLICYAIVFLFFNIGGITINPDSQRHH